MYVQLSLNRRQLVLHYFFFPFFSFANKVPASISAAIICSYNLNKFANRSSSLSKGFDRYMYMRSKARSFWRCASRNPTGILSGSYSSAKVLLTFISLSSKMFETCCLISCFWAILRGAWGMCFKPMMTNNDNWFLISRKRLAPSLPPHALISVSRHRPSKRSPELHKRTPSVSAYQKALK